MSLSKLNKIEPKVGQFSDHLDGKIILSPEKYSSSKSD